MYDPSHTNRPDKSIERTVHVYIIHYVLHTIALYFKGVEVLERGWGVAGEGIIPYT